MTKKFLKKKVYLGVFWFYSSYDLEHIIYYCFKILFAFCLILIFLLAYGWFCIFMLANIDY